MPYVLDKSSDDEEEGHSQDIKFVSLPIKSEQR